MDIGSLIGGAVITLTAFVSLITWIYQVHVTANYAKKKYDELYLRNEKLKEIIDGLEKQMKLDLQTTLEKKEEKMDKVLNEVTQLKIDFSELKGVLSQFVNQNRK
jgi:predicted RNA-binding protein with RPS1 domain